MTIITLTTDFGLSDGFVGIMQGVILGIAPHARLVDLSHDIAPQNVRQASHILARAAPDFPAGTIHLAVVDPGVGSQRRPLLVTTERARYVGPDNGIFSHALAQADAQAWMLDQPSYWLPLISRTFHGRDIFAPVAAHLAAGVAPARLAQRIDDPVRLALPEPRRRPDGRINGEIVYVDHFGNLISNVPAAWVARGGWMCRIAGHDAPLVAAYAEVADGAAAGLRSSNGAVELAVRNGNASRIFNVGIGEKLELWPST
jgi:S-adenosylmethionine hydrolase